VEKLQEGGTEKEEEEKNLGFRLESKRCGMERAREVCSTRLNNTEVLGGITKRVSAG